MTTRDHTSAAPEATLSRTPHAGARASAGTGPVANETGLVVARPQWVLLALEAQARGFKSKLAFRRWCRRNAVELRAVGKLLWVRPADVDAVLDGAPAVASDPVAHALRMITGGR